MFYFENGILNIKRFIKITYLSNDKISFLFKNLTLEIIGKELKVTSYYDEEAFVKGIIERINFINDKSI